MFYQYFLNSDWAMRAYGVGTLILSLWILNACLNLRLNDWQGRFYDQMQEATQKPPGTVTFDDTKPLFVEWALLSGVNALTLPIINWLTRHWAFQWREALSADYLFRWRSKVGRRAGRVEGASQRVQDDCYKMAQAVDSLGQGLLAALLQLITFCPLLWRLSSGVDGLPDGVLMWLALGGVFLGYAISVLVGWRLVGLEYDNQGAEAAFRKELVYAEDEVGEHGELSVCHRLFRAMRRNYHTLFNHLLYFEAWSATFFKALEVAPMLLMAPHVYNRSISLGTYMQSINAFQSVTAGMTMPLARWVEINIFLSVTRRLKEFEAALPSRDELKSPDETCRLIGSGEETDYQSYLNGSPDGKGWDEQRP